MKNSILVAPLNWGLGHATRCIPIIRELIQQEFEPHIASDGMAMELLRKEFPELISHELPSYKITYSKKKKNFKYKLIYNSPKIVKAIKRENKHLKELVDRHKFIGIISDNRLGIHHPNIPSVFVSHQLNVLSGSTTWLSTKLHQYLINKFDECWVPDFEDEPNLSGLLGHATLKIPTKYLGAVSRFSKLDLPHKYDLMVLLSGPEPQRQYLEDRLIKELEKFSGRIIFIRGVVEEKKTTKEKGQLIIKNYLVGQELEQAINSSSIILSRSGYTTILDLCKLEKKAFFIPTPGQFEQEYLAERLQQKGLVPFCTQEDFTIAQLERVGEFSGLRERTVDSCFKGLFNLFESK